MYTRRTFMFTIAAVIPAIAAVRGDKTAYIGGTLKTIKDYKAKRTRGGIAFFEKECMV